MNEQSRLLEYKDRKSNWKKWGPYLSERAWSTVREDHGPGGPWKSFPFDQAHSRVYRFGEDGLAGICDRFQYICFAFALWNGKDPLLKERLFGLGSEQGNHGEDVKEIYYYLDATPTSSYLKMLYKYPYNAFPYDPLKQENQKRGLNDPEFELLDTKIFDQNAYFDLFFEYAKGAEEDIYCRVTIINRGNETAPLFLLPTIWFRNTWSWGYPNGPTGDDGTKPSLFLKENAVDLEHDVLGTYTFYYPPPSEIFFTENEDGKKEAFHRCIIQGDRSKLNQETRGTKAAPLYKFTLVPDEQQNIYFRLTKNKEKDPFVNAEKVFNERIQETNQFYETIQNPKLSSELKEIQRQAFAGMLFSKQFYYLDQLQWYNGDPNYPPQRDQQRNKDWEHLTTFDLISMPDKWEYPYFCAWDLAFHCIPMVLIDPEFAKRQLLLMTREWYMHPSGQLPAYEWSFSDVNPPVHAWALWRVYKIDARKYGTPDRAFLEGVFHKLLLNFTWWVNKKDIEGNNIFQGGFLGMDNISFFDRSRIVPGGGHIDQSDGSAWMSFYCIVMMKIAFHLSENEPVYQAMATKFFEHFLRIASAMTKFGGGNDHSLWNEEDGFFYDILHLPNNQIVPLKVRSLVGLLPLLAVETLEPDTLEKMPDFKRRMDWFISKREDIAVNLACIYETGIENRRLLSIVTKEKLIRVLKYMLDENEFLSPYGIRSLSKFHKNHPCTLKADDTEYVVRYVPGESDNRMFGGNSNWRGPIWFPINFLLIEALQKYHYYYGDSLKVEFPTGSGVYKNLWDVAAELSKRLIHLFIPNEQQKRPIFGDREKLQKDPHFSNYLLFHEYFHGDHGLGLGASHQTGWTALIAKLIQQSGELF